jgi:prepilin-type N-terminal cleavage/methylation domain-containing protein/prepilin-type processing-associated H-X9-DG protein
MRSYSPACGHRRGFTLVELLVVIAVIAILAAIAMPAATRLLESGQKATCLGNMRALSSGLLNYTADNNNRFPVWGWAYNEPSYAKPADRATPPAPFKPRESGKGDVRCGLLMRGGYVQSEKSFCCPVHRDNKSMGYEPWGYTGRFPGCTYALNGQAGASLRVALGKRKDDANLDFPLNALRTPPSQTVMLLEESASNSWRYDNGVALFGFSDPSQIDSLGTSFHSDVGNVVFFDGSARSMSWQEWRTNAFGSGKEKAKQFFGGIDGFYW